MKCILKYGSAIGLSALIVSAGLAQAQDCKDQIGERSDERSGISETTAQVIQSADEPCRANSSHNYFDSSGPAGAQLFHTTISTVGVAARSLESAVLIPAAFDISPDDPIALFYYIDINSSGAPASAAAEDAMAIGEGARSTGNSAIAFGKRAQARFDHSFAFGNNAQTSRHGQFVFGTAPSTYTMPGLVSPTSRDVQTGPLALVTVDGAGNLATDGGETLQLLQDEIGYTVDSIDSLTDQLSQQNMAVGQNTEAIEANTRANLDQWGAIESLQFDAHTGQDQSAENSARIDANQEDIQANTQAIRQNSSSISRNRAAINSNTSEIDLLKEGAAGDAVRFGEIETQLTQHDVRMAETDETLVQHAESIAANTSAMQDVSSMAQENQDRISRSQDAIAQNSDAVASMQLDFERMGLGLDELASALSDSFEKVEGNTAGIAIANALAGSSWLQSNETVAFTLNAGYFDGSSAVAISGATRLHEKWSANFAVGTVPDRVDLGARAGLRVGW